MATTLPDYNDVIESSNRLSSILEKQTPVFTSNTLDEKLQAKCFFKCENFQRSGSFKFRGAYSALSQLNEDQRNGGVWFIIKIKISKLTDIKLLK